MPLPRTEPAGPPPIAAVLVVVPARDERDRIGACLTSIAAARARVGPGLPVSVTVAADRCTDDTAEIAAGFTGVDVVEIDIGCAGGARRAGVASAVARLQETAATLTPDVVLLVNTDADCVVPGGWLADTVALAGHHVLVQGEVHPDPAEIGPRALAVWEGAHPPGTGALHGANLAVRLDAYLDVGGFAEVATHEDVLLVRALHARGLVGVPGTRVRTSARREGRAPGGFAHYLSRLDASLDTGLDTGLGAGLDAG